MHSEATGADVGSCKCTAADDNCTVGAGVILGRNGQGVGQSGRWFRARKRRQQSCKPDHITLS